MPRYTIEILNRPGKPGGSGITTREVGQFSGPTEATMRATVLFRDHKDTAMGWRVIDDKGAVVASGDGKA